VNGDVRSGPDAARALAETGCAGVMVGRRAIEHPWVFREIRSFLDRGVVHAPPTADERLAMCRAHLEANVAARGEHFGVRVTRRHLTGYLKGLPGAATLRKSLLLEDSLAGCLEILASYRQALDGWAQPSAARASPISGGAATIRQPALE
jgi:tRNA-dihydrouridine synthase